MKYILLLLMTFSLIGTSSVSADSSSTLDSIKKSGKIKIGYRQSEPPMSFDDENGNPVGYSIDLCKRIASNVSTTIGKEVEIEYVPVTSKDRFSAVSSGKVDILCGSTTKTLTRREKVDFTQNTFVTGASFMTLAGSQFNELAQLDGAKVGVVKDTTTEVTLKKLLKDTLTNAEVVTYNTADEAMDALRNEEIRAFTSDQVVLIGLVITAKDQDNFAISPQVFSFEPFALAVKRNDADFRLVADRALSQLNRTGQILQIYNKWFGGFAKEMPPMHQALYQMNSTPE